MHFSAARGMRVVTPAFSADVIESFRYLLTSVGWSLVNAEYAQGYLAYPFGIATCSPADAITPKRSVGCPLGDVSTGYGAGASVIVGGAKYVLYNPYAETPVPGLGGTGCVFVSEGLSIMDTLTNMATAITGDSPFLATASFEPPSGYFIRMIAKQPGPYFNGWPLLGNGNWSNQSSFTGGGWEFESAPPASIYRVKITGSISLTVGDLIYFDFTINGTAGTRYILNAGTGNQVAAAVKSYTIVANPHSFAIFDPTDDYANTNTRATSLFACAPYIVSPAVTYAVFVIAPHQLKKWTYWNRGSTVSLNGPPSSPTYSTWPRLLQLYSPNQKPLLTPDGKPMITTAYVSFGPPNGETGIVGIVWDAVMISDQVAQATPDDPLVGAYLNGHKFVAMGSQPGYPGETRGTFAMCFD